MENRFLIGEDNINWKNGISYDIKEYHEQYRKNNIEKRRRWCNEWRRNNRDRVNASKYISKNKTKMEVFNHYGKGKIECNHCGFKDINALCLDHINDNGAEHRKKLKMSSRTENGYGNIYAILKNTGYPEGLQILCANCNMIKESKRKLQHRMKNKFYSERIKCQNQ